MQQFFKVVGHNAVTFYTGEVHGMGIGFIYILEAMI